MTAPRCTLCPSILDQCAILNGCTTCTSCAIKALKASRPSTHAAAVVASSNEWSTFVAVLRECAVSGVVHQRDVRPRLRGRIKPQSIGKCYSRAIREGVLVPLGREESDDVVGRNTNKLEPYYRLERAA